MISFPNIPAVTPLAAATNVWLCAGVPWDSRYRNVRLFDNAGAAQTYIISKAVYSITESTPIRNMRMRVNVSDDVINQNINYIAYRNTQLSNKMFYGFITNVTWLSMRSCEITFEFDVFQTWYYDCNLERSFTVREHVADDTIGLHIVPEGLDIGDLKCQVSGDWDLVVNAEDAWIMALTAVTVTNGEVEPVNNSGLYGNVFSGLGTVLWPTTDEGVTNFRSWMSTIQTAGQLDSVAVVCMVPKLCVDSTTGGGTSQQNITRPTALNGYTPVNNKLLTYPYLRLVVNDNMGNDMTLRWEWSTDSAGAINLQINGYLTTAPVIEVKAINYDSQTDSNLNCLTLADFPQCSWLSNAFYSWYAQSRNSRALTANVNFAKLAAGTIMMAMPGLGTVAGAATVGSAISNIASQFGQYQDKQAIPDTAKGQVLNDNLNFARNTVSPRYYIFAPQADVAESIDNFLTMYGYKVNKLKVPETKSRTSWNYVETRNCTVTGNVAREYIHVLEDIFNNGVTIWHTNDIGNYSLSNAIVGG